nr:diguanylate cyclase [Pseudomonas syringae]
MSTYPVGDDDEERIRILNAFSLMDTPPEHEYDQIVQMASRIFDAPIVLISLVHRDRQFFKARVGLDVCETGRDVSFCNFALMGRYVFLVPDALQDERFSSNALVVGAPYIRFYAGAPLITPSGHVLGSLCLIDNKPRETFSERDQLILQDLAVMVIERMELRRLELENEDSHARFMNITSTSPDAIICSDSKNRIISWNNSAELIFGHRSEDAMGKPLDIIIPPEMRSRHHAGLSRVSAGGPASIIGKSINLTAIHRDGHTIPIELSLSQWTYAGEPQFGAIIRDITQRVEADKLLKHAAEYDHLTGLANRSTLKRRIKEACGAQLSAAILLIDLDGFKDVNDTLGHAAGDFVLQVTSLRLRENVPASHMVARLGGDEFVVFLSDTADPDNATRLGLELIAVIEEPIEFEDNSIYIGASIGVSVRSGCDYDEEQMLGNADLALYQAKSDGRSLVRTFTSEHRQTASRRGALSSSMRQAWANKEFELYYQPQVRLADSRITGAGAAYSLEPSDTGCGVPGGFSTCTGSRSSCGAGGRMDPAFSL